MAEFTVAPVHKVCYSNAGVVAALVRQVGRGRGSVGAGALGGRLAVAAPEGVLGQPLGELRVEELLQPRRVLVDLRVRLQRDTRPQTFPCYFMTVSKIYVSILGFFRTC